MSILGRGNVQEEKVKKGDPKLIILANRAPVKLQDRKKKT